MFLGIKNPPVTLQTEAKSRYDIWASHADPELREMGIQALQKERKGLEAEVAASQLRHRKIRTFFMFEGIATGAVAAFIGVAVESAPLVTGGIAVAALGYVTSKNYEPTTHAAAALQYVDTLLGTPQPNTAQFSANQQTASPIANLTQRG